MLSVPARYSDFSFQISP